MAQRKCNLLIRLSDEEMAMFRSAAASTGLTISGWGRMRLRRAALFDIAQAGRDQGEGSQDALGVPSGTAFTKAM